MRLVLAVFVGEFFEGLMRGVGWDVFDSFVYIH
jgi:hypothetical protein